MPTPNTGIPYVPENTTDPAAGLNLALNVIDALLQTAVIDMNLTAPPGSPTDGDLHIVAASATGDWAGEDNNLARYVADGAFWQFYDAGVNVHLVLNKDDGGLYAWDGAAWVPAVAGGAGAGDVVGPASSVADRIAAFNGTTGKLLKDGGKTIAELRAPAIQSVTSSATVTPTFSDDMVKITAQAAGLTLANPTGTAIEGLGMVIRIKDNGTARSIAYGSQYRAIGITLPTTTVIGKTTYIAMIFNSDDTTWDCLATGTLV